MAIPPARAKDDKWVEARSANFIVVSNASTQQARNTAIHFEQIREMFRQSFTYAKDRPTPVITILAAKDEDTLRQLLPEYWATKGHAHPSGIFINSLYQMSVAVQLSGMGENPYEAINHEYYHSLTVPYFPRLTVWISEGMADFYGNSTIGDKTATLGMANPGLIALLHQEPLIPLSTLFQVDHSSRYYNEGDKATIFYAESWALTHYLMLGDNGAHRQSLGTYLSALGEGASQEDAAAKAFGDLGQLQKALQSYVNNTSFYQMQIAAPPKIPESAVQVRPLSDAEASAYRGGFLSLHKQYMEADQLLREAARIDPNLALAQQNLAVFYILQDKSADALTALSAAIELDPNNTLTRFLRAQLISQTSGSGQSDTQVETDLRTAITVNPNFAPAYGLLAAHLGLRGQQLPEALEFAKKGVLLEPGNISYQIGLAQVLARMRQYDQAEAVALRARANALDPNGRQNADQFIEFVHRLKDAEARNRQIGDAPAERTTAETAAETEESEPEKQQVREDRPRVEGMVTEVQCKVQNMLITVTAQDGPVKLHSSDYTNIEFISDIPIKSEEFYPCTSLKGQKVRVWFLPTPPNQKHPYQGEIGRLEIRR